MKKVLGVIVGIIFLFCTYALWGNRETKISGDYSVGVVYTAVDKSKSDFIVYDDLGKKVDEAKIQIGGINLANFDKAVVHQGDKVYLTMPVLGRRSQDFMIQLDSKDLSYTKIQNQNKKGITSFAVDEEYAYLSNSDLSVTYLTKVKLTDAAEFQSMELEGSCKLTRLLDDVLVLFCNINDTTIRVYFMNPGTLEIQSQIDIEDASFITDAMAWEGSFYVLINRDGKDRLSNRIVKIDGETLKKKELVMPFENLSKIYLYEDCFYIIEHNYNGIEQEESRIAILDAKTEEVIIFETENNHLVTDVKDGKLYSTDGIMMYQYDLERMELEMSFRLEQKKNRLVTAIFAK